MNVSPSNYSDSYFPTGYVITPNGAYIDMFIPAYLPMSSWNTQTSNETVIAAGSAGIVAQQKYGHEFLSEGSAAMPGSTYTYVGGYLSQNVSLTPVTEYAVFKTESATGQIVATIPVNALPAEMTCPGCTTSQPFS